MYRSFHAAYLERVRAYHETAAYQRAMRRRAVWVEPLFGEAKDWHGLRRFRLRGLWRVNCEALLIAAGQNLKRWLSRTGWGRRHGPAGHLALSSVAPVVPPRKRPRPRARSRGAGGFQRADQFHEDVLVPGTGRVALMFAILDRRARHANAAGRGHAPRLAVRSARRGARPRRRHGTYHTQATRTGPGI